MKRTLVVQPLPGIGDMVWHLPHLHAIAGEGKITVLTKRRSRADQWLLDDPAVEEVIWLERDAQHAGPTGMLRLARELRARCFDTVWLLHGSLRYAWIARLAGIGERIGYGGRLRRLLLNRCAYFSARERREHPIRKAGLLLQRMRCPIPEPEPRLQLTVARKQGIANQFAGKPQPWVALGIGSSEPFKQWGAERYARLCCLLQARGVGCLFLVGGPTEEALAADIIERTGAISDAPVPVLNLSIADTAALLSQCALYVGNDTGFLNISAAAGVPSVGLFGGSPPLEHAAHIHCILPDDGSQPWYGSTYMDRIAPESVVRVLEPLLPDS